MKSSPNIERAIAGATTEAPSLKTIRQTMSTSPFSSRPDSGKPDRWRLPDDFDPRNPDCFEHHTLETDEIDLHYAALGDPQGTPVIFCHGFPEIWYSWRRQLPALASAGYRAIAPDMRGFGASSSPPELEAYESRKICQDLIALLDRLGAKRGVFVGHDFGGMVVWHMALMHPDRVRAVASANTPFYPHSRLNPVQILRSRPGRMAYQVFFMQTGPEGGPGPAEAELEADVHRTLSAFYRGPAQFAGEGQDNDEGGGFPTAEAIASKGFLNSFAGPHPQSDLLDSTELTVYARAFERTGFRGPLNWYRNLEANWRWLSEAPEQKISRPALMITAGRDPILTPRSSQHMERFIPQLERAHIEASGHWTQQEFPEKLNAILLEWLQRVAS